MYYAIHSLVGAHRRLIRIFDDSKFVDLLRVNIIKLYNYV